MNAKLAKLNMFLLMLFAFVTGYILIIALKSYTVSYESEVAPKYTELIEYIEGLESDTVLLESDIIALRAELEKLRAEFPEDSQLSIELQTQIDKLNTKAGLKELSGNGIIITLDDNTAGAEIAKKSNPTTFNPEKYIIHYNNLLYLIRDIAPYAEGIGLNDIRITDNFNIRCVGTVIMLNSTRIAPPFKLSIIGNQDKLAAALEKSQEYLYLKGNNMPVKYSAESNITLPAAASTFNTSGIESLK